MSSINYTSEIYDARGRDILIKIFDRIGVEMFYHTELVKDVLVSKFKPYLLSSYFRIAYHVKTIKPTTLKYPGDMYYYDYDEGMYIQNAETFFTEFIKDKWKDKYLSIPESLVYKDLRASTYISRDDFKKPLNHLAFTNGTLVIPFKDNGEWDFSKKYLKKNSPEDFVTSRFPLIYNPNAKAVEYLKFVDQVFHEEDHDTLQDHTGYLLLDEFLIKKILVLAGPRNTGKSTFGRVMRNFVGPKNTTSIPIQTMSDGFQRVQLYNKPLNLVSNLGSLTVKDISYFLQITGGDPINAARKFKDGIDWISATKHIMSSNELPPINKSTLAVYERIRVVIVNKTVFPAGEIETDLEKSKLMSTSKELSGILNYALIGLERCLENKCISNCPGAEETERMWLSWSDPLSRFLESGEIDYNPEKSIIKTEFRDLLWDFTRTRNLVYISGEEIGRRMKKDHNFKTCHPRVFSVQRASWKGIYKHEKSDEEIADERSDEAYEARKYFE